ncbi:hypothetical protein E4U32_004524 [Claviceps aff. humidiphila group G2b]|nr:hypothetical protein E4U32_004524 [Claviceps aff. humidiphila group G2b]
MASNAVVALQIRPVSLYSYVLGTEKTEDKDDSHHFTMVPSKYDGNITALEIMEANFNNYELQHTNSGSACFQVNEKAKKKKTCGHAHTSAAAGNTDTDKPAEGFEQINRSEHQRATLFNQRQNILAPDT